VALPVDGRVSAPLPWRRFKFVRFTSYSMTTLRLVPKLVSTPTARLTHLID
jgi:hypothetical protein